MNEAATSSGDLFINGALLPALWPHTGNPEQPLLCPVGRRTFAAARWAVHYAAPEGGAITQMRSADAPPVSNAMGSLELRPMGEVTQTVFLGQRIEAAEAAQYRGPLVFSAWLFIERAGRSDVELHASTPSVADMFGGALKRCCVQRATIPGGGWTRLELPLDARDFAATGLSVQLVFAPELLRGAVRVAQMQLARGGGASFVRPSAIEAVLAGRFFQRYDSTRINSLGRALVVNAHELHFQFTFPEMRAFPACTLPHSEEGLRVFHLEGIPQSGFRYDVTYRSRSSVIIRATKENHGLADGFLSFVGGSAAILLDAEL